MSDWFHLMLALLAMFWLVLSALSGGIWWFAALTAAVFVVVSSAVFIGGAVLREIGEGK